MYGTGSCLTGDNGVCNRAHCRKRKRYCPEMGDGRSKWKSKITLSCYTLKIAKIILAWQPKQSRCHLPSNLPSMADTASRSTGRPHARQEGKNMALKSLRQ